MAIPKTIEILAPWRIIDHGPRHTLGPHDAELHKEVRRGHVLLGIRATAVALRVDLDDVLFELEGATALLAVVHLTWQSENVPPWPITRFFESWEQWVRDDMVPSHEEYIL